MIVELLISNVNPRNDYEEVLRIVTKLLNQSDPDEKLEIRITKH